MARPGVMRLHGNRAATIFVPRPAAQDTERVYDCLHARLIEKQQFGAYGTPGFVVSLKSARERRFSGRAPARCSRLDLVLPSGERTFARGEWRERLFGDVTRTITAKTSGINLLL